MSFLWGSAPNPAHFFKKSGGKIIFYRRISNSLRSCDIRRLFLILLDFGLSFTSVNYRSQGWISAALNFADEALRGIYWALPKLARGIFMGLCPKLTWVFYGALPQTPPAFLKKVGEKQYFTAVYPTHSVRAIYGGFFWFYWIFAPGWISKIIAVKVGESLYRLMLAAVSRCKFHRGASKNNKFNF